MPKRIAVSELNASTIDILNTIRANASASYQASIPTITQEKDIPKVGEVLYGYPALANEFIGSLVNRIAFVQLTSATFNNAYASLKKGQLEFGETVEEVFTDIIKALAYSAEKAQARELKRYLPNVRTAFHAMNWKVMYPVTIQEKDLRQAFISAQGVQDLIADIIDKVYTSNEYDEFLLFKYMIIKGVNSGKFKPIAVNTSGTGGDIKNAAKVFRATSNKFLFMNNSYNEAGVTNTCPKERQAIFMDADFNAAYDVDVLAAAFNMDKAEFAGKLHLIDDWTTFDNDRFDLIRAESDELASVTSAELAVMANVKAVLVDERWFQIYDNLNVMTEREIASGLYWNYFYHVWKTISNSPFSNAVVFIEQANVPTAPANVKAVVESKEVSADSTCTIFTFNTNDNSNAEINGVEFIQTSDAVSKGVAVHKYGAVIVPSGVTSVTLQVKYMGITYGTATLTVASATTGTTLTFAKPS